MAYPTVSSTPSPDHHPVRRRADQVAELLDDAFELPGGWRFGWDALIGMIPGIGDLVTTLIGVYILRLAMLAGAPSSVLVRMAGNIAVDALVGAIPFLGDIFDFAVKSNRRNARLLSEYLDRPQAIQRRSQAWVAVSISVIASVLVLAVYGVWQLFAWMISHWGLF
jgi:hypothetical protein